MVLRSMKEINGLMIKATPNIFLNSDSHLPKKLVSFTSIKALLKW